MSDPRPNIVLVMTDQHAARVLGASGDRYAQTPALDALAARGTRFENCYCPSPLCVPSRMAFLTGLEPHVSGVLGNDDYLRSDIPTIAHAMGAAGYECRLIGRMHFYGPDQHHGFASRPIGDIGPSWPGSGAPDIGPLTSARGNRGPELEGSGRGETSYQAYDHAVTDHAEREINDLIRQRDSTGRPFFALVSLFCPHPPYIAQPEDYNSVVQAGVPPVRLPPPAHRHPALAEWAAAGGVDAVSASAIGKSRAAYYALVRMIDRLAGRVLATIADRTDTVAIYTSDHGEALGERGLWWKSTFHEESVKVPLIISGDGFGQAAVDQRVTSLMDLSATLLGLSHAPNLPGHTGRDLRDGATWPDQCMSSYYGGLMNIRTTNVRHRMIRQGRYKLCWYDGHDPQLFDLWQDPDELNDIAGQETEILATLTQDVLAGWSPDVIRRTQQVSQARTNLIRDWVARCTPDEPTRWHDPNPERNKLQ